MTETVRHFRLSPSGYRLLQAAIVAAGLKKRERLPPWEEYVDDLERTASELEEQDIVVLPTMIDVHRMLTEISEQGLRPDAKARAEYTRSVYGDNPLTRIRKRRRWREKHGLSRDEGPRSGTLVCWQDGTDSRWERYEESPEPARWLDDAKAAVVRAAAPKDAPGTDRELLEWERPRKRRPGE